MKLKNILAIAAGTLLLASCSIKSPVAVSTNPIGSKTGVAERVVWFGFNFGHTDLSITTAAKNGGISKIATVDSYTHSGLFKTTYKTIVTGE